MFAKKNSFALKCPAPNADEIRMNNKLLNATSALYEETTGHAPEPGKLERAVAELECDLGERDPDSVGEIPERFDF